MKNLHLKNLTQKPNGLVILKKLNNPEYYYNNKPIPKELIKEIEFPDKIEIYFKPFTFRRVELSIYTKQETNKISEISCYYE